MKFKIKKRDIQPIFIQCSFKILSLDSLLNSIQFYSFENYKYEKIRCLVLKISKSM